MGRQSAVKKSKQKQKPVAEVIPLYGRDEMNLIEFPFGPITAGSQKTFEVEHPVYDKSLKREVSRRLLITGSDAFGLPRPIDDQVLMGMKALTYESGFQSRHVKFSRYQLCRAIGWSTDGRAYRRLEEAFDRIAGTTFKFKDSWWDKGESAWKTKTFHLIEEVELCSRDQIDRARIRRGEVPTPFCSFIWGDVIWKSFQDGFIKQIDMEMYRRISSGHRREVPLRLYRILDKRFYRRSFVSFDIKKLCVGKLGINSSYAPSQMLRVLQRATDWLVECDYLREMQVRSDRGQQKEVLFVKAVTSRRLSRNNNKTIEPKSKRSKFLDWFEKQSVNQQADIETKALGYAKMKSQTVYTGYKRNQKQGGDAFQGYREVIIENFLKQCWDKQKQSDHK